MSSNYVCMFPGQGSQFVGMAEEATSAYPQLNEIFEKADTCLQINLRDTIDKGPEEALTQTSNTQPALLVTSIAWFEALKKNGIKPNIVLGHSLGEYSALTCSGVLSFEDALLIVRERGILMEKATTSITGGMAAVIGSEKEQLNKIVAACSSKGVIEITNFNSPQQLVLSGEMEAIKAATDIINEEGPGKAVPLNVSAPFHSSLMKPVAEKFSTFIDSFTFNKPAITFIDNVSGEEEKDPSKIKEKLVQQLYRPVLWEKGILTALDMGGDQFIECGPGRVLSGLVKRISRKTAITSAKKLTEKKNVT